MNEALDDILADSDDEEEEQAIVNQVLDEIGIEITNKVIIFGTRLHMLGCTETLQTFRIKSNCHFVEKMINEP